MTHSHARTLLVTAVFGAGMVLSQSLAEGTATADPTCAYRSKAHQAEHGGFRADSAWHVLNGELPTCLPEEYDGEPKSDGSTSSSAHDGGGGSGHDKKSRYCRKRWFC